MFKRRLSVESLESRRLLAVAAISDESGSLIEFDGLGPSAAVVAPELIGEPDAERPLPMEAHHFIAVLRPIPEPAPANGDGSTDGGEGEFDRPLPIRAGVARFFLNRDESSLRYRLNIPHLQGVDEATIHLGKPGSDGPAVATLFDLNAGALDGIFVRGSLTDDDVSPTDDGSFDGTLASLAKAMRSGEAYVEVASADRPEGALAGGIRPLGWRPWHNPANRMDVTGDKLVTPQDALTVVEDMNTNGSRMVEAPMLGEPAEPQPFVDVSGDNIVSPRDALELIEFLSSHAADLLSGDVALPETVSKTVEEIRSALELDPSELPDVDFSQLVDQVLEQTDRFEEVVDRIADEVQQQYERHYAETIGAPPVEWGDVDWEQLYQDAEDRLSDLQPGFENAFGESAANWFGEGLKVVQRRFGR